MRRLPNLISALRLVLSPFVPILSLEGRQEQAFLLFVVLALSDALDGFLARRAKVETLTGKLLDPLADKFLLLSGFLSVTSLIGPYLLVLLLSRDLFLVIGSLLLRRLGFVPEPSLWGKLTTLCVSLTIMLAFSLSLYPLKQLTVVLKGLEILSAVLILISWIDYALRGISFLRGGLIIERR